MFGLKNDEILTYFLLIVVGYCIAKMFSKSCNGFSVGGENSGYQVFEPDPKNYPDIMWTCGYKYKENGDPYPGSFLNVCGSDESCVCLDEDKNIKISTMDKPNICRINNNFGGRCMTNEKLNNLNYPKYTKLM